MIDSLFPVEPAGRLISYLPMAHLADRCASHYASLLSGASITFVGDISQVLAALIEVRPTAWGAVPRIWEKMRAALQAGFAAEPDVQRRAAVSEALQAATAVVRAEQGRPAGRAGAARCARARRRGGLRRASRPARPRPGRVPGLGRGPDRAGGARVLRRAGPADLRGVGHERDVPDRHHQPAGGDQDRHRGQAPAGHRALPRRRRRAARARPDDHAGLSQGSGEDRGDDRRAGLAPQRRHRRDRRGRLRQHRRSQEGADHQRGRQEHVAVEHREQAQGGVPADRQRRGDRRPAPLQHGADRARPDGRGELRGCTRAVRRDARATRRAPGAAGRGARRHRARQREPQPRRTDQAPHDPARGVAAGRGRADARR